MILFFEVSFQADFKSYQHCHNQWFLSLSKSQQFCLPHLKHNQGLHPCTRKIITTIIIIFIIIMIMVIIIIYRSNYLFYMHLPMKALLCKGSKLANQITEGDLYLCSQKFCTNGEEGFSILRNLTPLLTRNKWSCLEKFDHSAASCHHGREGGIWRRQDPEREKERRRFGSHEDNCHVYWREI